MNIYFETERYVRTRPYIRQALKAGIVNYSKLARRICSDLSIKSVDAVIIALRRLSDKLDSGRINRPIVELLKLSDLVVRNKIDVFILEPDIPVRRINDLAKKVDEEKDKAHILRGHYGLTVIVPEKFRQTVKKSFSNDIISLQTGLVEVLLRTSKQVESTPGVMGYLYSMFAENNINILETFSSWTDTVFIINERDLSKAMEFLRF